MSRGPALCPCFRSEVDLLRDRVIDFDTEIPHGAFDLRVTEQELHRAKIACASVDQHCLCPAQGVIAELLGITFDAGHPLLYESCILPRRQSALAVAAAGEQNLASFPCGESQLVVDGQASLVREFETYRPSLFLLSNGRSVCYVAGGSHVIDADGHNVTTSQFAVDRQIEQFEVALLALNLHFGSDGLDLTGSERGLGTNQFYLVPRDADCLLVICACVFLSHGLSPC